MNLDTIMKDILKLLWISKYLQRCISTFKKSLGTPTKTALSEYLYLQVKQPYQNFGSSLQRKFEKLVKLLIMCN